MIDSHAHLDMEEFNKDLDDVLARARSAGVETIITIGTDSSSSRKAAELAAGHPDVWATVGVHPHDAEGLSPEGLDGLREMARMERVVAIGEIGLDYYYLRSGREIQLARFADQIRLARDMKLPVVVHSRDAKEDLFKVLLEEKAAEVGGVLHCFTGDWETAERALDMGFYISFSGIVTFPKAVELQAVAKRIPDDRLLIETDCPYLAPVPVRGKRNEPAFVRHTAAKIAELLDVSINSIDLTTTANARRVFRLLPPS